MAIRVVVGAQWGDEGKGKIVDLLSREADVVVRYQGGANAGHTINLSGKQYVLHLIPSGILNPRAVCIIGNGVVLDPLAFTQEVDFLTSREIDVTGRLFISDRAHLIFSYHKRLDQAMESREGQPPIGTTGRGIGPAYVDKFNRSGIRATDLFDETRFLEKLRAGIRQANLLLTRIFHTEAADEEKIVSEMRRLRPRLLPFIQDTTFYLNQAIAAGREVLLEGAQGTLLDVDHGTYPYVTSSNPVSGGACTGSGIGPTRIDEVIGVMKAYTTRVGEGPFPTELTDDAGRYLRESGREYGATTGRPRRCGWFDLVIARYAAQVNGLTQIAVTKLDVLDSLPEIQVCTGYRYRGKRLDAFPADISVLEACEPDYDIFPGWQQKTEHIERFEELPENARNYIETIERILGVPVRYISVGPRRNQTIFR